jgi:CHAD domain-containing protein
VAYDIQSHHDLAVDLRRITSEQVERIGRGLAKQNESSEVRVHDARRRIKRVRALLRLLRPIAGEAWFDRENSDYRDIARQLSPARDADVMLRTLDMLESDRRRTRRLRDLLTARRAELLSQAGDAGTLLAAAAQALQLAGERIAGWTFDHDGYDLIEDGLLKTYRRGRRAMAKAFDEPTDERLHQWRKRVKDLGHQLRLIRVICPERIRAHRSLLSALGEALGDDHDLAVLRPQIVAAGGRSADMLLARLDAARCELQTKARRLGEQAYAEKPRAFARRMRSHWTSWCASRDAA